MNVYGCTALHEILDDFVVFRNLDPVDSRLPKLQELRDVVDIPAGIVPRKGNPDYARVVVQLLKEASKFVDPNFSINELVYLGDTKMNDGNAFKTIAQAGDWPGIAFIGTENKNPPVVEHLEEGNTKLFLANRWSALRDFESFCIANEFHLGEGTAVIVDLDKTALGARGRNDHIINQARVEAVRLTVGNLLGEAFDLERFQAAYDLLNEPDFHFFTTDNQDYLAYICLILSAGLYKLDSLVELITRRELETFEEFISQVNDRIAALPPALIEVHNSVYSFVLAGDPTPFKDFRYHEYQTTVSRMECKGDINSVSDLLANYLVITQEVRDAALRWKERGALLFGLSDKPDEASLPREELIAKGFKPIHRVEAYAVGA
ncbi:MAG: hypothetical protein MUP11_04955 [Anaerolineales bacterium]|nr:hypothetical protein [Anaerolineales bacterium]